MKQTFKIVKLYFYEPLALMSEKKDEFQNEVSSLSSDMLKAAIVSALANFSDADSISDLNDDLRVSSAFLFYDKVYFFPKPLTKLPIHINPENIKQNKQIKHILWIEQSLFEKVINNETFDLEQQKFYQNGKLLVNGQLSLPENLYKAQTEERVSIGNTVYFPETEKGSPYYISRTYFYNGVNHQQVEEAQAAGLYFIYDTKHEDLLVKSLSFLQDEGFGADRRVGNGRFRFELTDLELRLPDKATHQMLVSKYIPEKDLVDKGLLENSFFRLHKTSGYAAGSRKENMIHWKKKSVFMLKEGAIFPKEYNLNGKNVKLSTDEFENVAGHPLYRDGRPVSIPIEI